MKRFFLLFLCLLITYTIVSCKEKDTSVISSDIEIVKVPNDKLLYDNLQQVEKAASLIVEAVPEESLGQSIDDSHTDKQQKNSPNYGYTSWEMKVTKIVKGNATVGTKLTVLLEYYISKADNGLEQLITFTSLKPPTTGKEYIMFLYYDKKRNAYLPVCDYEGMFPEPDQTIKEKVQSGSLTESDLEVYSEEPLKNLLTIYTKVVRKYFH